MKKKKTVFVPKKELEYTKVKWNNYYMDYVISLEGKSDRKYSFVIVKMIKYLLTAILLLLLGIRLIRENNMYEECYEIK